MEQAVARRMRLEQDLHGAGDRGELGLVYQPVYSLADRGLVGAEALLRWRHPEHGEVAPTVFVDVAEQRGLIEEIGGEVLRQAIHDASRWQSSAPALRPFVSVNVSPWQLRNNALVELVGAARDSTLPPEALHLELTETALIGDEPRARRAGLAARTRRARVAGRFRHRLLRAQPPAADGGGRGQDRPQLHRRRARRPRRPRARDRDHRDGAFAGHVGGRRRRGAGGPVRLLRERGCDFAQGFLLGHPLEAAEFSALLRAPTGSPA